MGFSSLDCKSCGHPALCDMATDANGLNNWMTKVVVLYKDGTRLIGYFDGYCRVDDIDIEVDDEPELWHGACWEKAGRPEYSGPSNWSEDQGWFFNDGTHSLPDPTRS